MLFLPIGYEALSAWLAVQWACGCTGVSGVSPLFVLCKYLCKQAKCIMCPVLSLLYFQKAHNKWPKVEQGAQPNRKQQAGGQEDRLAGEEVGGGRRSGCSQKQQLSNWKSKQTSCSWPRPQQAVSTLLQSLPVSSSLFHSPGLYVCLIVCLFPYRPAAACIVFGHKLFGFRHVCHYAYAFTYSYSLCCFLAFDLPAVCRLSAAGSMCVPVRSVCVCACVPETEMKHKSCIA